MNSKFEKSNVFLSYSHKDKILVDRVALLLQEREIDVWYDEWKLVVGSSLIHEIQEGIRKADFIVVFFSKNALASPWVLEEYEASKIRQIESRDKIKILPARVDECGFPLFESGRVYADFRVSFVSGFTGILKAILGIRGMNIIDQAFERYARMLDMKRASNNTLAFSFSELQEGIRKVRDSRWHEAAYSVRDIADALYDGIELYQAKVTDPEFRDSLQKFEKYLGNTICDFHEFRLFDETLKLFNELKEVAVSEPLVFFSRLLEHLYQQLGVRMRYFGMPTFGNAETYIVRDLDYIFSPLIKE